MLSEILQEKEKADAFIALSKNPQFLHIRAYLEKEVERSKGEAVLAAANISTSEVRRKIIAWQEREKVLLGIDSIFEDNLKISKELEEEIANERSAEHARSTRQW